MRFEFHPTNTNLFGELLYLKNECSLLYRPFNPNVGIGILCGGYVELNVIYETGQVVHLSGLSPKSTWSSMEEKVPESIRGNLFVYFNTLLVKGSGVEYNRCWQTYHNEKESSICIGDYQSFPEDICIEFANDVFAVLRGNQLVAIWAKIRETEGLAQ